MLARLDQVTSKYQTSLKNLSVVKYLVILVATVSAKKKQVLYRWHLVSGDHHLKETRTSTAAASTTVVLLVRAGRAAMGAVALVGDDVINRGLGAPEVEQRIQFNENFKGQAGVVNVRKKSFSLSMTAGKN